MGDETDMEKVRKLLEPVGSWGARGVGEDVEPLLCLMCGEPDHKHRAATSTTREDHVHAAEFYGTCVGDVGVQHRLYPEAFPTPGPYGFHRCDFVETDGG